jgi:hypothetical protein
MKSPFRSIIGSPKIVIGSSTIRSNGVDVTRALTIAGFDVDRPIRPWEVHTLVRRCVETMRSAAETGATWAKAALYKAGVGVRYITRTAVEPHIAAGTNPTVPDPTRAAKEFHPPSPDPSTPSTPDEMVTRFGTKGAYMNREFVLTGPDVRNMTGAMGKMLRGLRTVQCAAVDGGVRCGEKFTTASTTRTMCALHAGKSR